MSLNKPTIIFLAVCSFFICTSFTAAQDEHPPVFTEENFSFSYDYAFFRSQEQFVLIEIYYSILRDALQFVQDGEKWKAEFVFTAEIRKNDSLLAQTPWKNVDIIDSLSQITSGQRLYGVGYFAVKPGDYMLKVELQDINSQYSRQYQSELEVEPFTADRIELSDIQLASQISRSNEPNRFFKNGYMVIPNSERFYGTGLPMLMFYAEIYNLKKADEPDTTKYMVQFKVLGSDGQVVREFPEKMRLKPGNSAVEVSGVNIISFRSGTYFLELSAHDLFNDATVSKRKKFYVYREGDLAVSDSVSNELMRQKIEAAYQRIYDEMSIDDVEDEFDAASYIASSEEKKIFKTLDSIGKRAFLIEFWKKRDETPQTPENEFRQHYLSLVRTANEQFKGFKKGWKTDRGRVLLLYGVPDEIERFPYSAENKPHIIWKYFSIQGGVMFVFVDKRDFGRYELVHSTARGELNDAEWERWIRPN
ncbi:MAG TPA: GWxTD domain-containing protein [bacterium]|nr:GWxTD domain-containing protein [bacterium]